MPDTIFDGFSLIDPLGRTILGATLLSLVLECAPTSLSGPDTPDWRKTSRRTRPLGGGFCTRC